MEGEEPGEKVEEEQVAEEEEIEAGVRRPIKMNDPK